MLKCKVCGHEFTAIGENHYVVRDNGKVGLAAGFGSNQEETLYDAFDCPRCCCQYVAQERKRIYKIADTIAD